MSLKAYDGMMTRKGVKYIQDEIIKRLDKFKEASKNKLAKTYADIIISHVDENYDVSKSIEFDAHNEEILIDQIKKINIDSDTTILSYIFQCSRILSKGYFVNDFMTHLNLIIECKCDEKTLVYPGIIVNEHKDILLEFLDDWYCQNQTDPDEEVAYEQWEERERDWYDFNEVQGFEIKMLLFDPNHHWNNLNEHFRGDELINKILENIPTDENRIRKIARNALINKKAKDNEDNGEKIKIFNILDELAKEGNTEIDDYIKSNNIQLIKIDADFIKDTKMKQ